MRFISCKKCREKVSDEYSYSTNCQALLKDYHLKPRTQLPRISRSRQTHYTGSVLFLLRQSLRAYGNNLPLLVPAIVSIIATTATSFVMVGALPQLLSSINSVQTLEEQSRILGELFGLLPYLFAFGLVSFLVTLGLMTMVGQIVTGHKCKLSDWTKGIQVFFWRIFAVSIVVGLLFGLISEVTAPITLRAIRILAISIQAPVSTLSQLTLYFCCAAIIVDNAGLQASISLAIKAIRRSGRNFVILFVLYLLVLYGRTILGTPNLFATGFSGISSLSYPASIMSPQVIAFTIFSSLLLPLWLLVIFKLYCGEIPQN